MCHDGVDNDCDAVLDGCVLSGDRALGGTDAGLLGEIGADYFDLLVGACGDDGAGGGAGIAYLVSAFFW